MAGPHLNVLQAGRRSLAVIQNNPRGPAGLESRLMESLGCMGGCGACPNRLGCGGGKPSEVIPSGSPRITASMLDSLVTPAGSQNEQRSPPPPPKEAAAVKGAEMPQLIMPSGAEMSMLSWLAETELRKQKSGIRYSCELFLKNDAPSLEHQDMRPKGQRDEKAPMREEEKRPDAPAATQGRAPRLLDVPSAARPDSPAPVWSAIPSDIPQYIPQKETPAACQSTMARVSAPISRNAAPPPAMLRHPHKVLENPCAQAIIKIKYSKSPREPEEDLPRPTAEKREPHRAPITGSGARAGKTLKRKPHRIPARDPAAPAKKTAPEAGHRRAKTAVAPKPAPETNVQAPKPPKPGQSDAAKKTPGLEIRKGGSPLKAAHPDPPIRSNPKRARDAAASSRKKSPAHAHTLLPELLRRRKRRARRKASCAWLGAPAARPQ